MKKRKFYEARSIIIKVLQYAELHVQHTDIKIK